MAKSLQAFRKELKSRDHERTFSIPYDKPIPEALVRKIMKYCVKNASKRDDDAFW